MMKKLIVVLLAVLLALTLCACSNSPDESTEIASDEANKIVDASGNVYTYEDISSNTIAITGYKGSFEKHAVTVPERIGEKAVVSIGEGAFKDNNFVTEITLPSTVTSIGSYAFANCDYLTTVHFTASALTSIGEGAFYGSAITEISIPSSVTTIGKGAFWGCAKLETVTFEGEFLTTIEDAAFRECTSLIEIAVPTSVTSIGNQAFYGCEKLATVTLPEEVEAYGSYVFTHTAAAEAGTLQEPAVKSAE